MSLKPAIAVVARMDCKTIPKLFPAMGRTWDDTLMVQDIETSQTLGNGLEQQLVKMVTKEGAKEVLVVGSLEHESAASVIERVNNIKNCPNIPETIPVHGLLLNPKTFELQVVVEGYEQGAGLSEVL